MKIGIFDPYLDTLSGGEKYMLTVASCLASNNEVFIFWDKEKEEEIKQVALKKLGIDLSLVKFCPNIFSKNFSFIARFRESSKFDAIIYLSDGSIPLVGTRLYVHFQFPIEWVRGNYLKMKIKIFFVRRVFCNSYFTKYLIDRKLRIKSRVLYPPVKLVRLTNAKKENVILHVGRFSLDKNGVNYKKQDIMINTFKKMIDSGLRSWKFVLIAGVKSEDKDKIIKLKEIINGYPIEIIENPSNQILWECYEKTKIYWHATGFEEDLNKFPEKAEHFGISTVESMSAGAVPVVINAGGQKEIVEEGKSGFLWDSLDELRGKTYRLIREEELWEKMSKEAQKRAIFFEEDRFCKELKGIIFNE